MKVFRLIALAVFGVSPAAAYLGEVVASFNAPANLPGAVATSGDYIYVFCAGRYLPPFDAIFQINATTGSRIRSYVSPFGGDTSGLGYEYGGYLWISRYNPTYVGRCNATNGSVYSSFPVTEHSLGGGIACQGDPTRPGVGIPPRRYLASGLRDADAAGIRVYHRGLGRGLVRVAVEFVRTGGCGLRQRLPLCKQHRQPSVRRLQDPLPEYLAAPRADVAGPGEGIVPVIGRLSCPYVDLMAGPFLVFTAILCYN
jgi:hypothetical protein